MFGVGAKQHQEPLGAGRPQRPDSEESAAARRPAALVAVYGSLKQGEANHHWLRSAPRLAIVHLQGLALYDLGPYPMAVPCSDHNATITAELYAVNPDQLRALDLLEDHPNEYVRELRPLDDGRDVWIYLGRSEQVSGCPRLPSGQWCSQSPSPRGSQR